MPKVSICIPAYNQTNYLSRTLTSIVTQSFTDYEVIITDDSHTTIVRGLLKSFDFKGRLKYYHNEVSLGSPENWNRCISKATGIYIKIMHHDDWFTTEKSLETFVDAMDSSGADFAFSNAEVYYSRNKRKSIHTPGDSNLTRLTSEPTVLFFGNFIGAPSMTMYKNDTRTVFDRHLKWLVDIDFYISYLKKHPTFIHIDKPLLTIATEVEQSVTSGLQANIEIFENFYMFEKLSSDFSPWEYIKANHQLLRLLNRREVLSLRQLRSYGSICPRHYLQLIFCLDKILSPFASFWKWLRRHTARTLRDIFAKFQ